MATIVLAGGVRVRVAATPWRRLVGLAGRSRPAPTAPPLLLVPCRSVHTCGMRCALDLVWLDRYGGVVRVDSAVPPWRLRSCRSARAVLEVAAGGGAAVATALGRGEGAGRRLR
jgi:uncharacterized membrane protein (UPF0127 family)